MAKVCLQSSAHHHLGNTPVLNSCTVNSCPRQMNHQIFLPREYWRQSVSLVALMHAMLLIQWPQNDHKQTFAMFFSWILSMRMHIWGVHAFGVELAEFRIESNWCIEDDRITSNYIELHYCTIYIDRMGLLAPNAWGRTSERISYRYLYSTVWASNGDCTMKQKIIEQTPWISSSFESVELSRLWRTRFQGRKPVARVSFSPTCRCPPFACYWPCVFTWLWIEMGRAVEPFPIFWVSFQADGKIRMPK